MKQEQEKQDIANSTGSSEKADGVDKATVVGKAEKPKKNLYEPYATPIMLYNIARTFVILILTLSGRIRLRGRYNVPKRGPYIIAANHLSWVDIPLVPAYLPGRVIYMAKEEAFASPIRWLVRFLGAFPVKRGEGDRQALRAANEQLHNNNVLGIFPEGTRSKTHALAKAHAGLGLIALRSQAPVVPVAVWGSEKMFRTFRPTVTISYGKPIILKPKGNKVTREDIDEATETVMRAIAAMLPPEYRGVYGDEKDQ